MIRRLTSNILSVYEPAGHVTDVMPRRFIRSQHRIPISPDRPYCLQSLPSGDPAAAHRLRKINHIHFGNAEVTLGNL